MAILTFIRYALTKKLCSRLSSSEVRFYTENGRFAFLSRGNVRLSS